MNCYKILKTKKSYISLPEDTEVGVIEGKLTKALGRAVAVEAVEEPVNGKIRVFLAQDDAELGGIITLKELESPSLSVTILVPIEIGFDAEDVDVTDPAAVLQAAKEAAQSAYDDGELDIIYDAEDNGITLDSFEVFEQE